MHLMKDSKSLLNIISKGMRTSKKRIMVDIHAAQQAYESQEILNIGFVRSAHNLADGFTNLKMQSLLLNMLKTGIPDVECEQRILRPKCNSVDF